MNNKSQLTTRFEVKASGDKGSFVAYGNVFNVIDDANDITMHGAFANTIENHKKNGTMPKLLAQHGHTSNPIGIITDMIEDEKGLRFEGEFNLDTQAGKESYALVMQGALNEFSIGYMTLQSEKQYVGDVHVRALIELDVKEISLVTFACNPESKIESIKSALSTDEKITTRMVQGALQESGLSKRQSEKAMNQIKSSSIIKQEESEMTKEVKQAEKPNEIKKAQEAKSVETKSGYWMEECLKSPVVSTSCVQEILWYLPPSALETIIDAADAGRIEQAEKLGLLEKSTKVDETKAEHEDEEDSETKMDDEETDSEEEDSETKMDDEHEMEEEEEEENVEKSSTNKITFTKEQLEQISKMSV